MKSNKFIKILTGLLVILFVIVPGCVFAQDTEEPVVLTTPNFSIDFQLTNNKSTLNNYSGYHASAYGGYLMYSTFDVTILNAGGTKAGNRDIIWKLTYPGVSTIRPDQGEKETDAYGKVTISVPSPVFDTANSETSKTWSITVSGSQAQPFDSGMTYVVKHHNDGNFSPVNSELNGTVGGKISFEDKAPEQVNTPSQPKKETVNTDFTIKTQLVDKNRKLQSGSFQGSYTITPIVYGGSKGNLTVTPNSYNVNYTGSEISQTFHVALTNYIKGTYGVSVTFNKGVSEINYSGKSYTIRYNFYVDDYGNVSNEQYINSDISISKPGVIDNTFYLIKQEEKPVEPAPQPQPEPTPQPQPSDPGQDSPSIDPPTVPVSSVSVRPTSLNLKVGNSSTLTATVSPNTATNKNVSWSSGNRNIATVDSNGRVTAVAAGTTIISVKTSDGSKTASCGVTVTSPVVHKDPESITLTASSITMDIGNSYNIVATIQPADAQNKDVTWTSSSSSVATVSGGNIIAKGPGTTTITAKTVNGKTATCKVTVNKPAETVKKVNSVTLDKTKNILTTGDSFVLKQTIKPEDATNKNVTWTSSNENVAVVTGDGKVIAEKAGSAIITVVTVDGNVKATCTVTVKEPENKHISVTGVTLNQSSATLKTGESLTLNETVVPSDATNKATSWYSTNDNVAQVDEYGIVKAINAGSAEIYVSTEDGHKTAKCTLTVNKDEEVVVKPTEEFKPEEPVETPQPEPDQQPEEDKPNTDTDNPDQPIPEIKPDPTPTTKNVSVSYETHIENIGWGNVGRDGGDSGTTGRSLRLEGIKINVSGNSNLGIAYATHVEDYGWMDFVNNGTMSGTEGQCKRLEAIKIQLIGSDKDKYDVYYRVHAQDVGWMNWAKNGASAGTAGFARRLEAIEIQVVPKGQVPAIPASTPNATDQAFLQK